MESWKDIKGYEGKYQISNMGNIKVLVKWCGNKSKSKWINETSIMKPTDRRRWLLGLLMCLPP